MVCEWDPEEGSQIRHRAGMALATMTDTEIATVRTAASEHVPARGPRSRSCLIAIAAVLVAVALLGAGTVAARALSRPPRRALGLRLMPGQTLRYGLRVVAAGFVSENGGPERPYGGSSTGTLEWRVGSIDPRGVASVELTLATAGGAQGGGSGDFRATLRVAPDGRVLAVTGSLGPLGQMGVGLPGLQQLLPVLPLREVRPGDAWQRRFDQPVDGGGPVRFTTGTSFLREAPLDGTDAAIVRTEAEVPVSVRSAGSSPGQSVHGTRSLDYDGQLRLSQTAWLDQGKGQVLRSFATAKVQMNLSFRGFPLLFPTFDPGRGVTGGAGGLGGGTSSPFLGILGSGSGESRQGTGDESVHFRGTLAVSLWLLKV